MSMLGNMAVSVQMDLLLKLMDSLKDLSPEEQLARIRKYIEETKAAADSGWL